ncbi:MULTISPECIES: Eco57I restriction-modification methylase domain-containing protein [Stenotrophomonas]|uniref:site-specific DNA-methyltransferase (adenine-specific) n=1 Tax=Stenotrophomonas lactitubi TaxID=2045214 RepID=A0AAW4GHF0_9GAMM|nr:MULTISPECIES: N-6 DNA methylase [Stenotrophomonas]MBM9913326.1 N-6 DNA methylase [Stenotrophomonas lactitubi]MBM9923212.1 N-6 DNA methylase [Stenotrophomonas lactitubi]MBM9939077.1 N-6 DNA methylase [Stenotrophomonas lactitubi]
MKRIRKAQATLNLPTLKLEGGLFLPDQLEKAAQGRANAQLEADYGTPKGVKLKDEYSRAFQIACAQWQHFAAQLERADVDAAQLTTAFVHELLRDAFGYAALQAASAQQVGELRYPVSLMAGTLPVLVAPHTLGLDEADACFAVQGGGNRKKAPFQAMQELLNASEPLQWGIVSNGKQLRLLRDAASLTRPSFLEVDLADLLGGQRYAEFANVWRLLHASRAARLGQSVTACIWEQWRSEGQQEGTRVRDGLRNGVEQALLTFGAGFLQHPANHALRAALNDGTLSKDDYFQQLLRLIYRLIFVFTVEERGVLHPQGDSAEEQAARRAYAEGYALAHLRELCLKRRARTRHDDQWQAIRIVIRGLARGEPRLALPSLGGLFAPEQCPDLDTASLDNTHLLTALQHLRWAVVSQGKGSSLTPVDYRNMGPEELGSVYESLLELVPAIDLPARTFGFVGRTEEGSTAGNARKLTGSYYTPDSLVQELIKSALDPVIEQRLAAHPANPTEALLTIRVVDPACGSGHFLLAAARRLAEKLAQFRSLEGGQEGAIQPQDYRHALREVVARCIYGVDRNPMAIELARMALWLEGYEEGRPLGFLDHHLQVGDALLGLTDLNVLEKGIAKDAFKPLSGDDKDVCKELAKANAAGLKQIAKDLQGMQMLLGVDNHSGLEALRAIEALPTDTPEQVVGKEQAWRHFLEDSAHSPLAQAADALVGAYLLPKTEGTAEAVPTSITLHALLTAPERAKTEHAAPIIAARDACEQSRVFHWPLAFPQVFAQGGFDCVLGNPPWERIKLQEEEFFATRHCDVAQARNKAERAQRIQWLSEGILGRHLHPNLAHEVHEDEAEKRLYREFVTARRTAEAASVFAHVKGTDGGRYPLTGVGDVNTYALFAETILQIHADSGRAGFIVPTGIATDDSTKAYFGHITQNQRLVSLYDIENRDAVFPSVHRSYKFCLLTLGTAEQAEFVCFASQVSQLADSRRCFTLTPDEFRLINPNTLTCPVFRSERDAELTKKLYRAASVLMRDAVTVGEGKQAKVVEPEQNPWGISFMRMLDMSNDSHLFKDELVADHLPLYEAKLIHQFDHRWATYTVDGNSRDVTLPEKADPDFTVTPRYWVSRTEVEERLCKRDRDGRVIWQWERDWLMGWRRNARATDERTTIATVMPISAQGDSVFLWLVNEAISVEHSAALLGSLGSLTFDFVARQKVGGVNFSFYYFKQLPVLAPTGYTEADLAFIVPRVLELTYTAHDLSSWAKDLGYDGEPFPFDSDRRATLRAELDAWYAKLYGLTRDELRYILDPADVMDEDYPSETFRVLKNKEQKEFGEYRTQRLILAAWDALETQQPLTTPSPKPARRTAALPIYAQGGTPATEAEDWLAGLVCDVLLQAGPCDDNRLRRILGGRLSEDTPHAERLHDWLRPVNTERWTLICDWLRDLLGVAATAPLSIHNPEALADIIGDHRTASLARYLIEARRHHETALAEVMADSASNAQTDETRKRG